MAVLFYSMHTFFQASPHLTNFGKIEPGQQNPQSSDEFFPHSARLLTDQETISFQLVLSLPMNILF
jgi:hypothetical protein